MIESAQFHPDWVSPPGETIEDLLSERGWTQVELAERMGTTKKHVNDLVKGRAAITPGSATSLARVLGATTDFWLVREAQYRAALSQREAVQAAKADADWLKELPFGWMQNQGWVGPARGQGEKVLEALRFFGVASVEAWRAHYGRPLTAFRSSEKFEKKTGSLAAWLRRAELEAADIECAAYDKAKFKQALIDLRELTSEGDPSVFVPRLVETCAAAGVAVVFVPHPTKGPVSGATKWLTTDKALLVLSLRHKTNDHLWFTFFHEAGHLLLHGKKLLFIEGIDGLDEIQEDQADRFSRDTLIAPNDARRLRQLAMRGRVSKAQVRQFAAAIGVAPGIVVGRMQKENWLPWTHMNDLKVRYAWVGEG